MTKQEKSSTNNQWASSTNEPFKNETKKEKTAEDNRWTTTVKNNTPSK